VVEWGEGLAERLERHHRVTLDRLPERCPHGARGGCKHRVSDIVLALDAHPAVVAGERRDADGTINALAERIAGFAAPMRTPNC